MHSPPSVGIGVRSDILILSSPGINSVSQKASYHGQRLPRFSVSFPHIPLALGNDLKCGHKLLLQSTQVCSQANAFLLVGLLHAFRDTSNSEY